MAPAVQQPVSAKVVGNTFVQQYYQILHESPGLVYRFYKDISKVGRPEDNGTMGITTTMNSIKEKILSLNYGELRAEIKSVDAQESLDGGVHVLVTGYLTGKDNFIRNFAQTFFLAPQDRGYFVLNDMFRYVEDIIQHDGNQVSADEVEAPLTPEQVEKLMEILRENAELKSDRLEKAIAVAVVSSSKGASCASCDMRDEVTSPFKKDAEKEAGKTNFKLCYTMLKDIPGIDIAQFVKVTRMLHDSELWRDFFLDLPEDKRVGWVMHC